MANVNGNYIKTNAHLLENGEWYMVKNFNGEYVKAQYVFDENTNSEQFNVETGGRLPIWGEIGTGEVIFKTAKKIYDYYYSHTIAMRFNKFNSEKSWSDYNRIKVSRIHGKIYVDKVSHKHPSYFSNVSYFSDVHDLEFICSTADDVEYSSEYF